MQNMASSKMFMLEYEGELRELCRVKSEEFSLMGYDRIAPDVIWNCVLAMKKGNHSLHEFVSSLLTLQIGQLMHYETMNAFKGIV